MVTMKDLLECGVHFGHQTRRWNPKMKKNSFSVLEKKYLYYRLTKDVKIFQIYI